MGAWSKFWFGLADGLQAASDKLQKDESQMTTGQVLNCPPCPICGDKRRSFTVIGKFTYVVDRFGRHRVRGLLECDACGLRATLMRYSYSRKWEWTQTA